MDVFFTVDVEIWCDGWKDLDARFPAAFQAYVHGPHADGEGGLAYQARALRDANLLGVFFVEPLFSERFGLRYLSEIVGLLQANRQEVQLHLHPEWADEVDPPMVPLPQQGPRKRPLLRQYPRAHQQALISRGRVLLERAGAGDVNAFRAGSFGFDRETLHALREVGIAFDSSYNATMHGPDSGLAEGVTLTDVYQDGPVIELPMTVFHDGFGRLRHAQLAACSWRELEAMLWQALEAGRQTFVILSHNFELLTPSKTALDPVVLRRFTALVAFLDRHRDVFQARGFRDWTPPARRTQPSLLRSTALRTGRRMVEQAWRRGFR